MKSAFAHFDDRISLIERVIKPGYAALAAEGTVPTGLTEPAADPYAGEDPAL
jgi:hypothetical protein